MELALPKVPDDPPRSRVYEREHLLARVGIGTF